MLKTKEIIDLKNADVSFSKHFYIPKKAERLFSLLRREINWGQDKISVFGKEHWQPRLTAFYAENDLPYRYSNLKMAPSPFSETLQEIKQDLLMGTGMNFSSCLANLYRNGRDSNGWHADDERELGKNPVIASLSFGATRKFKFRRKDDHREKFDLNLTSGSLLLMQGETQHYWQHQIPKTKKEVGERINLTFRIIYGR